MSQPPLYPVAPRYPRSAFDIVVIAASMGGIPAIRTILATLPPAFPASIIVQMHLTPQRRSLLVDVLASHTILNVDWAADGVTLCPGTVTVAPPGQHVRVDPSGKLCLISWAQRGYIKPRADWLFESVAASFKARALGVVLTGYLDDGARGAQAIHAQGGRVLVEDPASATAWSMPLATIRTGCADFVLPIALIPTAIMALLVVPV